MEDKKIEQAEAHLKQALADLEMGPQGEKAAEDAVEETLREIKEAEHEIHFTVDGEPCVTERREMTPDEIIREFGGLDPATSYLVQIEGNHKISYQGKGSEPIKLHNGMKFQIISTGPTPVSGAR